MNATVYQLEPRYNATHHKMTYALVDMEDAPEVSEALCEALIAHTKDRLRQSGFGILFQDDRLEYEITATSRIGADSVDDLDYQVTIKTALGGEIGITGILLNDGEIALDHGPFIEL